MTDQDHPNASDAADESSVEELLRRTLAGHGTPPEDLPDLERAVREKLARRRTVRWQPLAAAIGVIVLVAGIVGALRLSGSDRAAVPGPNATVSSSVSVSGPTTSVLRTTGSVSTSPLITTEPPKLTLTAVPATKPYRTAPASFTTYGFDDPKAAPACDPATLSMNLVQMRTGPRAGYLGMGNSTFFTVVGREIGKSSCSLDQHGLPVQARDSRGQTVSQDYVSTADGRPWVRVDPGEIVVFQGSWDFFCGVNSGPLSATVLASSPWGAAVEGWTLPGTIPVPGRLAQCDNMAGGGPILNAVSVGRPGSFATLTAQLADPHIVTTGALSSTVLTLTNWTRTSVALTHCPDINVTTSDMGSDGVVPRSVVMRVRCPARLTLGAGASLEIKLAFVVVPLSQGMTRTDLSVDWYRAGYQNYGSNAASAYYGVEVNGAASTAESVPTTPSPPPTGSAQVSSAPVGSSESPSASVGQTSSTGN